MCIVIGRVPAELPYHWHPGFSTQVSARQSCPKRNARRGGRNWRQSGRSEKLPKVLSNWAHASWTDEGGVGEHGEHWPAQSSGWRFHIPRFKDQKEVAALKKTDWLIWWGQQRLALVFGIFCLSSWKIKKLTDDKWRPKENLQSHEAPQSSTACRRVPTRFHKMTPFYFLFITHAVAVVNYM